MISTIIKDIMTMDTMKVFGFNAISLVASFTSLDATLKTVLLIGSIVFTVIKCIDIVRNWKIKKTENEKPDKQ
jgi:hypothetical protein